MFDVTLAAWLRDTPERHTDAHGQPYAVAWLTSRAPGGATVARVTAKSPGARDALLALEAGDALAVTGRVLNAKRLPHAENPMLAVLARRVLSLDTAAAGPAA